MIVRVPETIAHVMELAGSVGWPSVVWVRSLLAKVMKGTNGGPVGPLQRFAREDEGRHGSQSSAAPSKHRGATARSWLTPPVTASSGRACSLHR